MATDKNIIAMDWIAARAAERRTVYLSRQFYGGARHLKVSPKRVPAQIAQARRKLGLTLEQFGAALGYGGSPQSVRTMAYRIERGERQLQPAQALLLAAYLDGWRPVAWPHASC